MYLNFFTKLRREDNGFSCIIYNIAHTFAGEINA